MTIHLIGIGGISMRGLAQYYQSEGHTVSGCDLYPPDLAGIKTIAGHDPSHIAGVDLVIYTSAIAENSPGGRELAAARAAKIRIQKRAEAIGEITSKRQTVTVSGMHGKSTTTGMIAHILQEANQDPMVMIGAPLASHDQRTFRVGRGPLVLEADEFDRSFLQFSPDIAVLTNIEPEHLDYFTGGLPEIIDVFTEFLGRVKPGGTIIACGDDRNVTTVLAALRPSKVKSQESKVITYGRNPHNDYQISESQLGPGTNQFTVLARLHPRSPVICHLNVPGLHNQFNATAALAVADSLGIQLELTCQALESFRGVGGRFELLSDCDGVVYISDYAHHPTEVAATIAAARAWYPKRRLVIIFQPHQYARTKFFLSEFATALTEADVVIVTDIFAVVGREKTYRVTAADLVEAAHNQAPHRSVAYVPLSELSHVLSRTIQFNDIVLFLGAGQDIARLADRFRAKESVS